MTKQRFLKILALTLSLCLLLTTFFVGLTFSANSASTSLDIWDGTSVSTELSGSGTAADPYLIQSGADLKYWSNKASGGSYYSNEYFKLTTDIDLGDRNLVIYKFSGTFDGGGHEIKGIKIVYNTLDNVGFFRFIDGTVMNLTLTGSAWGKSNVGGIAGSFSSKASFINCVNNMTVKGEKIVGGIVGNIYPGSAVTINIVSCVNKGSVTSTITGTSATCTGGFVGNVGANATINFLHSQNAGDVTSGATDTGGFVGSNYGNLKFDHCINTGTISGAYAAGGFIGWNRVATAGAKTLTLANCINLGTIKATRTDGGNGWLDGILGVHSGQNKSTTTADKVYSLNNCLNFGTSVNNQASATSFIGARKNLSDFTSDTVETLLGFLYVIDENGKPALRQYSEGKGTKEDPYVLKTKEDLVMLSHIVTTEQLVNYTNVYFELGNDIDLEGDARFVGIGNGYKSFQGDFDGKGYTVSGVDIKHAHLAGLGFFGLIGGSYERKISNLNVKGNVTSTASTNNAAIVGGLVGKNSINLVISNCSYDGTVYSNFNSHNNHYAASGLVCDVAAPLDINKCYVAGTIDGFGRGGSFVGTLNVAQNVNISNSYSTATVTGKGSYTAGTSYTSGGLIGFVGGGGVLNINNCYFAGTAPAERSSGMGGPIINHLNADGVLNLTQVYYLADSASEYTELNVGTNKTEAQFKDGSVADLLNSTGVVFIQGENYPVFLARDYTTADINNDGIVDTADAVLVLRHVSENIDFTLDEQALYFADINDDGSVTKDDYSMIKYIALLGIIVDGPEATSWSTLG